MALEQAGTITMAEMMKEIENLKTKNQALEEAKLKALQEAKLNRAEEDERISTTVALFQDMTKEVSSAPTRIEELERRIRQLIHDCRKVVRELENISEDMRSSARNGAVVQSATAITGIVGGVGFIAGSVAVVLSLATGGLSLMFGAVYASSVSGVVGTVAKASHKSHFQKLENKSREERTKCDGRFNEFQVAYEQFVGILDRFESSNVFLSEQFKFCEDEANGLSRVLGKLVSCLDDANTTTTEPQKRYGRSKGFISDVTTMHTKGASDEEIKGFIYKRLAFNSLKEYVQDGEELLIMKWRARCYDISLDEFVELVPVSCISWHRVRATSGLGVAFAGLILNASGNLPANVGISSAMCFTRVANCGSTLASVARGFAFLHILFDISNLISAVFEYRRESAKSEEVAHAARQLAVLVGKLETMVESIGNLRIELKDLLFRF